MRLVRERESERNGVCEEESRTKRKMPHSRFSGSLTTPKVDVAIDMGNPFLNLTVDGFLKIGTVGFFFFFFFDCLLLLSLKH